MSATQAGIPEAVWRSCPAGARDLPQCQQRSPLGLTRPPGGPTDDHATALCRRSPRATHRPHQQVGIKQQAHRGAQRPSNRSAISVAAIWSKSSGTWHCKLIERSCFRTVPLAAAALPPARPDQEPRRHGLPLAQDWAVHRHRHRRAWRFGR
jgi:hypothetical protein